MQLDTSRAVITNMDERGMTSAKFTTHNTPNKQVPVSTPTLEKKDCFQVYGYAPGDKTMSDLVDAMLAAD